MTKEKVYTPREEKLNVITHIAGAAAALGSGWMIINCRRVGESKLALAAGIFYWLTLIFMFSCSALYHLIKVPRYRAIARKFDHCAIYFLITGSYAPVLYIVSPDTTGVIVFGTLLLLSISGCAGKFLAGQKFHKLELILYIAMGWCVVFIASKAFRELPVCSLWLLVGGGVAYTAGVAAYVSRREFSHAVWHLFVLAGAALQFFAITGALDL